MPIAELVRCSTDRKWLVHSMQYVLTTTTTRSLYDVTLIERTRDDDCRCCWAASIFCCTYSNGAESFNVCEDGSDCPVLSGYTLVKSALTSSCSICTGSNSNNKTRLEAQSKHKMRVK